MSKTFLFKLVIGLALVVAAVLWLLSVTMKNEFWWFNLAWAGVIFSGVAGVAFIMRGVFSKTDHITKKFYVYFGAGLLVVALLCLTFAILVPKDIIWPIIAIIIAVGLLLGMIAVGGKKWDTGDNHKVGYKNYRQRKAEEEKEKNKDKK